MFGRWRGLRVGRDHATGWSRQESAGGDDPERRLRLLIESEDGAEVVAIRNLLDRHGYDVSWCPGPDARRSSRCPLVRKGTCRLVDEADAVLCTLDLDNAKHRAVVEALNTLHPEKPVIVAASPALSRRWARLLTARATLRRRPQPRELVTTIDDALVGVADPAPPAPDR